MPLPLPLCDLWRFFTVPASVPLLPSGAVVMVLLLAGLAGKLIERREFKPLQSRFSRRRNGILLFGKQVGEQPSLSSGSFRSGRIERKDHAG